MGSTRQRDDEYAGEPGLDEAQYRAIVERDFDFGSSQSLIFKSEPPDAGGMGDFVVALEAVEALKAEIQRRAGGKPFEFLASVPTIREAEAGRLLAAFPFFDRLFVPEKGGLPHAKFPVRILDATPRAVRVALISTGSMWDLYLAKWGVPGRFRPAPDPELRSRLAAALDAEFRRLRERTPFPEADRYVLFFPESVFAAERKVWPLENWQAVLRDVLRETDLSVVVMASDRRFKDAFGNDPRVRIYDYRTEPGPSDYLRLFAIVGHAACSLSLDTGPALASGFLERRCITLWGPTTPVFFGHRNNINLRVSACPPCMRSRRLELCQWSACMADISAGSVSRLLLGALAGRYEPR